MIKIYSANNKGDDDDDDDCYIIVGQIDNDDDFNADNRTKREDGGIGEQHLKSGRAADRCQLLSSLIVIINSSLS